MEHKRIIVLTALISLITAFLITKPNLDLIFIQSIKERSLYLNVSRETILSHPTLGVGAGNSVISMRQLSSWKFLDWQYQPVHNVFLLIRAELGIVGLFLFTWWLIKLLFTRHTENRLFHMKQSISYKTRELKSANANTNSLIMAYAKGITLALIFIMLFDHYLWDIQQGQILLWMTLGLLTGAHLSQDGEETYS